MLFLYLDGFNRGRAPDAGGPRGARTVGVML